MFLIFSTEISCSQYAFQVYSGDGVDTTTERDGVTWSVAYSLPGCAASFVEELSGKELAVQTAFNTNAWEKRQLANVRWDYEQGTMFAEMIQQVYTVLHNTHTCWGFDNCYDWQSYYFSGGPMPSFTVPDNLPAMTSSVEEPTLIPSPSAGDVEIPLPEATSAIEEPSSSVESPVEETSEPFTPSVDGQNTLTPTTDDRTPPTSLVGSTPTSTPMVGNVL
ncbi:hypothetical protein F4808DRAFT_47280 [Astrocystis sublimbata]|nr:hypothetical protein F4808DRAFT_47277 [Astrocystis sublimbata]KAI0189033.1 hypothetical protein F4808DRAFT_47280 [Astrocystis sublimbata]